MPRKYFRKYLPQRHHITEHRYLYWLAPMLGHHNLWHLNRRSVSGGVAIGMFAGLVPGPLQMLSAAILAVIFRKNLPVAMATTLYTNPFTIVPLYLIAYQLGGFLLRTRHLGTPPPEPSWSALPIGDWPGAGLNWLAGMGLPLALGLLALALLLAACGYVLVEIGWRLQVRHAWAKRLRRRAKARQT